MRQILIALTLIGGGSAIASSKISKSHAKVYCEGRLLAFNTYEMIDNGKVVEKKSIFIPGDWSHQTAFEGFLIRNSDRADSLWLEFHEKKNGKAAQTVKGSFLPWDRDPGHRIAKGVEPLKMLKGKRGTWIAKLRVKQKVVCEYRHKVADAD